MNFEIIGKLHFSETFAQGSGIRELQRLQKIYGKGHWRKCKAEATVKLLDGTVLNAEIHWYEAHGIGKREFKIKRYLE
ncbi:hypothetical protein [Candidatus Venteria ishoeyi]|uniref:Uncharacterized protein n=1 Tax=Candidatus Venteria ishoeyi TaxID=1899563 RepID=A0A1H6F6E5_9GAMM|nr:hypothetical protein [Candidatus Venteria ishoeyi]SEH05738.1 Uncharacterised protein [Candidatus Venteria ishoeyi]SEH05987.1 Uncharacterised protein [Candidatus Venteria ishoeyi]